MPKHSPTPSQPQSRTEEILDYWRGEGLSITFLKHQECQAGNSSPEGGMGREREKLTCFHAKGWGECTGRAWRAIPTPHTHPRNSPKPFGPEQGGIRMDEGWWEWKDGNMKDKESLIQSTVSQGSGQQSITDSDLEKKAETWARGVTAGRCSNFCCRGEQALSTWLPPSFLQLCPFFRKSERQRKHFPLPTKGD
jgi:hypothetical protein